MKLTKKQKILLDFIEGFIATHHYSPTLREIMRGLDYKSVSTVAKHVDNLVANGYLTKEDGAVRSLAVAGAAADPWANIVEVLRRYEQRDDPVAKEEAEVLRRALGILRRPA